MKGDVLRKKGVSIAFALKLLRIGLIAQPINYTNHIDLNHYRVKLLFPIVYSTSYYTMENLFRNEICIPKWVNRE